jgi:hypothetical protein
MEPINAATMSTPYYPRETTVQCFAQVSQFQMAAVNDSQWLDMSLITKEGDKVTLSVDAKASALYAAFGEVQASDADEGSARWGQLSIGQYEREVTMTVEGDLNRAERREIRNVMKTLNKMMKNFMQDKLGPMMAKAGKLQGLLHTIDSLQISMAYERRVVVAQETQAAISYDRYGETSQGPAVSTNGIELPLKAESESLATNMAQAVTSADAPPDPLREMADGLLKTYREQAARWNPLGGLIMDRIRNLFNAAVNS